MTTPLQIPLSPEPQKFFIQLAGTSYRLTFRWCVPSLSWVMDVADADDVPLVGSIPLVTGADLLAQYPELGIGGAMIVQSDDDADAVPTFENLGTIGHLYFVPSAP